MSIANVYVKVKYGNERYKSFAYRVEPSRVQLIYVHSSRRRRDWREMAPKEQRKGSVSEEGKKAEPSKGEKTQRVGDEAKPKPKKNWKLIVAEVVYTLLAILTSLFAVGVIVLSLVLVGLVQVFTTEQSGYVAGIVVVLVTAFVAIAVLVYALVTVFKKKAKGLFIASLVLLVLAVVQVALAAAVVHLQPSDETRLAKSLNKVYALSRTSDMKFVKQYHLVEVLGHCCGYDSPNDYKLSVLYQTFPPDVPISCCPSYDVNKSDFAQEKAREVCRQNRSYYKQGCSTNAMEGLTVTSEGLMQTLVAEAVLLLVLVVLGILGYFYRKKLDPNHNSLL